jgi:hypothetical protein
MLCHGQSLGLLPPLLLELGLLQALLLLSLLRPLLALKLPLPLLMLALLASPHHAAQCGLHAAGASRGSRRMKTTVGRGGSRESGHGANKPRRPQRPR